MPYEQLLIGTFVAINLFAFFLIAHDKRKSIRGNGKRRTPEGLLFFFAAAFGATGVYVAMHLFRHKTRTWYFQLGIPLLLIQQLALCYLLWSYQWL